MVFFDSFAFLLLRSLRSLDVPLVEDFSSAFGSFFVFFSFGYRESLRSHSSLYTSFKIKQKRNSKSYEKLLEKTALIICFFYFASILRQDAGAVAHPRAGREGYRERLEARVSD